MCKLRCLTMNIFQKSPNFQEKTQKRQNWRAPVNNVGAKECQLKLSIYEDLGLRYVILVKTISISESNWSTILLFRLNSFLKAHLILGEMEKKSFFNRHLAHCTFISFDYETASNTYISRAKLIIFHDFHDST